MVAELSSAADGWGFVERLQQTVAASAWPDDPWGGIIWLVARELTPIYREHGVHGVRGLRALAPGSAWASSALTCLRVNPLAFFSRTDLVEHALSYLVVSSFETEWAWRAIWYGELEPEDRWSMTMELIDRAPDDDGALWMIGDGPLSEVRDIPEYAARVDEAEKTNPRITRINRLVDEWH